MVSASGSKGSSKTTPIFKYLPGQEAVAGQTLGTFQDIFSGNMASPTARAMQNIVGEAGMRESAQERRRISETRGMSTPARQRAVAGAGEGAVSTMAKVPQEMWQKAAEYLTTYSMQAPAVGQVGKSSEKSFGGGICSCHNLRTLDEGELEESLREFRDAHFDPYGLLERGYKRMAEWFVPLVKGSSLIKMLGRMFMLFPLSSVSGWVKGENKFGWLYLPFAYFWISFWKLYGMNAYQYTLKHPRSMLPSYPSMTSTFISKFREVI